MVLKIWFGHSFALKSTIQFLPTTLPSVSKLYISKYGNEELSLAGVKAIISAVCFLPYMGLFRLQHCALGKGELKGAALELIVGHLAAGDWPSLRKLVLNDNQFSDDATECIVKSIAGRPVGNHPDTRVETE